jgi:SAM-dependent methyltransferase
METTAEESSIEYRDHLFESLFADLEEVFDAHDYERVHRKRFDSLIQLASGLQPDRNTRVLEVGRTMFTRDVYARYPQLTTLGFPLDAYSYFKKFIKDDEILRGIPHIAFDLNDVSERERWITLPSFDIILFTEVIEHLFTCPELVLGFLRTGLKKGGFLICTTPNAASIGKRIKMLWGIHPFERIRVARTEPGHFREYARDELVEIGTKVGLTVYRHSYVNWLSDPSAAKATKGLFRRCFNILKIIPAFRDGQVIIYTH